MSLIPTDAHNSLSSLTKNQKKFIERAIDIINIDAEEIGFVGRTMVSASMPHSKVKGLHYRRENNKFILTIVGNEESGGIPYGTYPRLILCWIASEVVKGRSREIVLGQSLSDFMKKLGLSVTGGRWGTITRFKDQLKRIFSAHITCTSENKQTGVWTTASMNITDKAQIFWDPTKPSQIDLFKSKIYLGEMFFEEILAHPVPVDMRAINALKESSLALDIYFWLTYRMSYLKYPCELGFDKLHLQFGGGYSDTPHGRYEFKRKFIHQLTKVLTLYPEAKVQVLETGLKLSPSPTHIKKIK